MNGPEAGSQAPGSIKMWKLRVQRLGEGLGGGTRAGSRHAPGGAEACAQCMLSPTASFGRSGEEHGSFLLAY